MTEKYERFQCTVTNGEVYNGRIFDQLCRMETTEVVDKLNKLTYENKQLRKEKRLLARFIRRNHDVSTVSRILKEGE